MIRASQAKAIVENVEIDHLKILHKLIKEAAEVGRVEVTFYKRLTERVRAILKHECKYELTENEFEGVYYVRISWKNAKAFKE